MNAQRLLAQYERIADAPDAIQRLRRFILDLAVRGKLVPQDAHDEPASELLKRVAAEKARLVKAGKVREQEAQPTITMGDLDFEVPLGWAPTRIGDLLTVIRGASPRPKGDPKYFSTKRTPYHWIKISDIRKHSRERILLDTDEFLTKAGMEKSVLLPKGTLVVTNSATIGVPIFLGFDGGCIHDGYLAFPHFTKELSQDFFFVLFQTLQNYAAKVARGMAQLNLNTGLVRAFPVAVPPLAEQHRIVGKVDELMELCDRLEEARRAREATRDLLTAASLARLNAPDPDTFQDDARFALDALPVLTTRPDQIKQLRQTILNLAVRGKLTPQDPNDEPASELLKRIAKEKALLVKAGEIRRQKTPKTTNANILPFEIKAGWAAATIEQILIELQTGPFGSSLHQSDYQLGGVPVVNPASIQNEQIVPIEKMAVGPATLKRLSTFKLRTGDIVMARRGEMGRCAVVTEREAGWLCGTGSLILRLPSFVFGRFFVTLIGSPYVRDYLGGSAVGATMQNLNQGILLNLVIGLPPLAEQHRIVAKVDELMVLCDRLDASLISGETARSRLLDALVHEALALAEDRERKAAE